ncbi:probable serine/threonine-protein kinase vps15 isoform X1 [Sesamum indicum]|uniref:non-specific serine/threonine protein kinase n=1 Tax=Sesamum indicum TaxID=4182 RepID=A0A6I9T3K5_SESIN|nr:probable serine/threonine-protein kinase vps15 isoform X1 [Sesamum indicum]
MGNKIARTTQASATEYYLHDLPSSYNLVLKEVLGRDRFLKSILCKHDEGLVLVKVYFKRGDSIDLRDYDRRLARIRDIFSKLDHPHVWPFQFWLETDKAAYLLRQYFFNNLHDRLSTRPFLSLVEKKWLAFQLLYAVKQSHEHGVCHGDIKCENVLVTSWNWLYLVDFASFKPTYIPYDDPSDFSFFFDTGGRRRCYVAPERFYEHGGEMQVAQDALLKPSMDIFSVGCVIAELFLEGQPLFELSQLLAYRRGQYDPTQHLEKIPDSGIRKMILHMIQLDPESRCSADSYLQNYAGVVFPSYFSPFLHKFYSLLNPLSSDARVLACETSFQEILRQMMGNKASEEMISETETSSDDRSQFPQKMGAKQGSNMGDKSLSEKKETKKNSHDRFDLLGNVSILLKDVQQNNEHFGMKTVPDSVVKTVYPQNQKQCGLQSPGELIQSISTIFQRSHHPFLKKITMNDLSSLISDYNNQSDTFGMPFLPVPQDILSCEGMVLIASLLCSCIRNVKVPFIRRAAVLLLKSCSLYIDDEARLQRILPYVIAVLSDPAAIVRCAALETLCDILPLVRDFPPSDAKIFPEYILPMLSMLPDDSEESVRICYASNISKLALTAYGFLIHSISLTEAGVLNETNVSRKSTPATETSGELHRLNSDAQLAQLRKSIAEVIQELVMGPKQTPNIRRALLQDIGNLCWFFGQKQSNDFLLPILPAFLNDRDEQLRAVFYGQIIYVCFFVGQRSVEEYLLPYIEQALNDITESVIVNALDCLAILCRSGFLRKRILLEMIERAFHLLCYPSKWVRRSAVTFIAASSENLGAVDSYVFLVPIIRPFLRRQPASLASEKALLACLKPPVSRELYHQVLENAKSSDMLERQRKIWYNTSSQSKQNEAVDLLQKTARELDPIKCWPDRLTDIQRHSFTTTTEEHVDSANSDDSEGKFKAFGHLTQNTLSQEEAHDRIAAEKSQLSGFMSPQMSCMNSFIDKTSESIPLYYFKVDSRRTSGAAAASDSSLPYNSLGFSTSSLPWMDPINKSFSLASSISAPKLVPGPVYVGNGPTQLRRVVHELEDRETDETAYISNKFHEVGLSDGRSGSSPMDDNSMSPEATELSSLAWSSTIPDSGWRPRGVLVAHLQEHRSGVNDISISMDQQFFVSASEDSTVKIWDCKKLEKDISFRSRLTYSLGGSRALCVAVLQGSTQIVVGASDGMIHMFSVDHISRGLGNVVENYSGIADVKKNGSGEGAILSLLNYSADGSTSKMVLYSTQNCGIHLWDTRTSSNGWNTRVFPEEGYISALVADPCGNWFVSGSSRGVLTLWDLRFCIPVNSWQYSLSCPIEKMCLFVPPSGTPLSVATRPLVYVAAGCNEVSLWNAENGSCHQVLRAANHESDAETCESPWALARPSSKSNTKSDLRRSINAKYRINELNQPSMRLPGIRALLPLPGGDLLTGGTDLKIRRWDHCSPDRSYSVCGPSIKGVGNDDFYETKSSFGVQVVQETKRRPLATRLTGKTILAAAATDSAGCHHDSILSLASVKLNQRLLISSSRDGAIKVWK